MIKIDGNQGEGGGQILRTSLALSAVTGEPVRVSNIRARRRNPGMAPQHLAGVMAAAEICDAEVKGANLRSEEIRFIPGGPAHAGDYVFDVSKLAGTPSAGAVTLLLQSILLPLTLADGESTLTLRGGTNVNWSPPIQYVQWVLLPTLARMGVEAEVYTDTLGWYPRGGGEVQVWIGGNATLKGIDLKGRGDLIEVYGAGLATNLPEHILNRMRKRARGRLKGMGLPHTITAETTSGRSTGAAMVAVLAYEHAVAGFLSMGERGKPAEQVAEECIAQVRAHHKQRFALDAYLPDQLLPFMTLAEGGSVMSTSAITQHTLTNINVVSAFIDRVIVVEGNEDQPGLVYVKA